eukprot:2214933-Rhodomonas_salina.1
MQSDVLGAESVSKDFPPFDGNWRNFKTFRTKTSLIISNVLKYGFIHNAATVCKNVLLTEYNMCTATKHSTFSTKFEDYSAEKFSVQLEAATIPHKLILQSAQWMVDHMGLGWSDFACMGYVNLESHADAAKEEQMDWLTYIQQDFITHIIKALFGDAINTQQSPYIDTLLPVVLTSENQLLD